MERNLDPNLSQKTFEVSVTLHPFSFETKNFLGGICFSSGHEISRIQHDIPRLFPSLSWVSNFFFRTPHPLNYKYYWVNNSLQLFGEGDFPRTFIRYEKLLPGEYMLGDPTQPHFSYEIFTNCAPTKFKRLAPGKSDCFYQDKFLATSFVFKL